MFTSLINDSLLVMCRAHRFMLSFSSIKLSQRINYTLPLRLCLKLANSVCLICSNFFPPCSACCPFCIAFFFSLPIRRPSCSTRRTARWNAWSRPTSSSRSSSAWRLKGPRSAGRSRCIRRPCRSRGTGCRRRGSRGWSRNRRGSSSRTGRPTGGSSCWERSTRGQIANQGWNQIRCTRSLPKF